MKYLFPTVAYFLFIFLISCDNNSENKDQLVAPAVSPAATNPISANGNDSLSAQNSGVALNPQHGQPGHRCDIAVGAPLTSPAATNNNQPNVSVTIPPATTNTDTKKVTPNSNTATTALNPQHGQPGHRCDIAVGAPLNSKPIQ